MKLVLPKSDGKHIQKRSVRSNIINSEEGEFMAKVHDVAAYIISRQRSLDAMKLQKLLYYSQAWSLVWDERPLFSSKIEAWANGPVVREVFKAYQGQYKVSVARYGNKDALTPTEKKTVDAVLKFYGPRTGFFLSELTHKERPWRDARQGIAPGDPSDHEITKAAMLEYYGALV
jgi:uncharacterized phage-associated protein